MNKTFSRKMQKKPPAFIQINFYCNSVNDLTYLNVIYYHYGEVK